MDSDVHVSDILGTFGINSSLPIHAIDEDGYLHVLGTYVRRESRSGAPALFPCASPSVNCSCVSLDRRFVAYADKELQPAIHIDDVATGEHVKSIVPNVSVEIVNIAFSADGLLLACLGGIPDYELSVWRLADGEKLWCEPVGFAVDKVSFDPQDSGNLCTSGTGSISFWSARQEINRYVVRHHRGRVQVHGSEEVSGGDVDEENNIVFDVTAHCWGSKHDIYCCSQQHIYYFSSTETLGARVFECRTSISSLELDKRHIVLGLQTGGVLFVSLADYADCGEIDTSASNDRSAVSCLSLTPSASRMFFLTHGGRVGSFPIVHFGVDSLGVNMMNIEICGDYHSGGITGVECWFSSDDGKPLALTCGQDATLRYWDLLGNKVLHKKCFPSGHGFTSLTCSPNGKLAFVTDDAGTLRVFDISRSDLPCCFAGRLDNVLKFARVSLDSRYLLCASDRSLHLLCITETMEPRYLGWVQVDSDILSAAWQCTGVDHFKEFFVSTCSSDLHYLRVPASGDLKVDPDTMQLDFDQLAVHSFKTDVALLAMASLRTGTLLSITETKTVAEVSPDINRPRVVIAEDMIIRAEFADTDLATLNKRSGVLCGTTDGNVVVVGDGDGRLLGWKLQGDSLRQLGFVDSPRHDHTTGGVASIAVSPDLKYILSTDSVGGFVISTMASSAESDALRKRMRSHSLEICKTEISPAEDISSVIAKKLSKEKGSTEAAADSFDHITDELESIKQKLAALVDSNFQQEDIDQLPPDEFLIDVELKTQLLAEGQHEIDALRASKARANSVNMLRAARLFQLWKSAQVPSFAVSSFSNTISVESFPMNRADNDGTRLRHKIRNMRYIDQRLRRSTGNLFVNLTGELFEESADKIKAAFGVLGSANPSSNSDAATSQDADEGDQMLDDEDARADAVSSHSLLWVPTDLYTAFRKVQQMVMLRQCERDICTGFNDSLIETAKAKRQILSKSMEKVRRVREINTELGSDSIAISRPTLGSSELPWDPLQVLDSELNSKSVDTRASSMKAAGATAGAGNQGTHGADGERALLDMMGGQLEKQEELEVDVEPERPEWMNKPKDQLSAEQINEIKKFDRMVQEIRDEKEKHRRQLETEIKKLKKEMEDMHKAFDGTLMTTFNQRLGYSEQCACIDFMCCRLAQSLDECVRVVDKLDEMKVEINALQKQCVRAEERAAELETALLDAESSHEDIVHREKMMDRGFKQQFVDADEHVDLLYKLYRRRERTVSSSALPKVDLGGDQAEVPVDHGLSDADRPIDLRPDIWEEFLKYRDEKHALEAMARQRLHVIADLRDRLDAVKAEHERLRGELNHKAECFDSYEETLFYENYNMDLLLTLRQGQVEVDQAAVVTDYSDGILVPMDDVEDVNNVVRYHGVEKVKTLVEIKDFRKEIHALAWENDRLEIFGRELMMKTRDYQLLRVTKSMQEIIKHGGSGQRDNEKLKIEKKMDLLRATFEKTLKEKKTILSRTGRRTMDKKRENDELDAQIDELKEQVLDRHQIVDLQSSSSKEKTMSKKLKMLRMNRKLKDLAEAQAAEVQFLKVELERLRERTYPTFAVAQGRVYNPDDRDDHPR